MGRNSEPWVCIGNNVKPSVGSMDSGLPDGRGFGTGESRKITVKYGNNIV